MIYVNLGCGATFVDAPDWLNLDFAPASAAVRMANLLARLPVADGTAALVYSSHFLEHVPRDLVPGFLRECWRVLQPGGVVRLVLPDLGNLAREYLVRREAGEHDKADFVVLEMIDQCVRRESGGELGKLYRRLSGRQGDDVESMIDYIRARTGEDLRALPAAGGGGYSPSRLWNALRGRLERAWIRLCLLALPAAFRAQNVSLAAVGERHHWLWDFHQLKAALEEAGFTDVQRCRANTSMVADFPFYPLDLEADGLPRKGVESMYVEARKPA